MPCRHDISFLVRCPYCFADDETTQENRIASPEAPVYDITPLPVGVTLTCIEKAKLDAEREYTKSLEAQLDSVADALAEERRVRGMLTEVLNLDLDCWCDDYTEIAGAPAQCDRCSALAAAAKLEEK